MAEKITSLESTRYAVVSGGNKGIGYETCKQLASKGVVVVLTSRDEKKGIQAIERLKKESNISNNEQILFHQLDIMDPASISSLVNFIKTKFGRLDILVNNAGIGGLMVEGDVLMLKEIIERDFLIISTENGLLCNKWATEVLRDADSLTEEKVDQVVNEFLKDFTEKSTESKGWPSYFTAYKVSKASLIAYTRVLATKYPNFRINSVCPGYCKTDVNANTGSLTAGEGAESLVNLALLPNDGPSGLFFYRKEAKGVLSDTEHLTEEKIEEVINQYLKDFKEDSLQAKGWPSLMSAYILSQAVMNAYSRIMAKKHPSIQINCICPGYVKTDISYNRGVFPAEEGAKSPVRLALQPDNSPSGLFFVRKEVYSGEWGKQRDIKTKVGRIDILNLKHEWAKGVLSDVEHLTEEKIEEVINEYLKDFKEDSLQAKGWPPFMSAYILSKAVMNAYSRIMAKKHPSIQINCVCPGFVKTDINYNRRMLRGESCKACPAA
ncbi:(+)-neomenthol dehydrogenase [Capsicum annuum]|nr:(+)-neomenthol dehydrogenase [Capsicum annuum]KAF3641350.1 (+)-neomenthol dehydrogenase [Capsicum annuum]